MSAETIALMLVLCVAAGSDLATRRIPNRLTAIGFAAAVVLHALQGPGALAHGLAGAGIAFVLGFLLFALGALGGGDAKLLAVVGAFFGLHGLVPALLAIALAGGVLAFAEAIRRGVAVVVLLNAWSALKVLIEFPFALIRAGMTPGARGEATAGLRAFHHLRINSPSAVTVPYGLAIALGSAAAWFLPLGDWLL